MTIQKFPTVYSVLRKDPLLPVHLVVSGSAPEPPHRHDGGYLRQGHQLSVSAQRSGAGVRFLRLVFRIRPDPFFSLWIRSTDPNPHCQ
jgi:hypothetical protein